MKFGCAYSFVEAPTNHSGNDSSGSTSYSRHEHFFHQMLLVFVPGTFLRVLTTSIILVQLSLESWKKKENHRAGPTGSTSEAAAAAVEKQVFGPILIHAGAKDMPPCFVLRQRPSMPGRNGSIRREEPSIGVMADLRPFVTHMSGPDTAVVSLAACLSGTPSAYLYIELLAEASLGSIFPKTKKALWNIILVLVHGTYVTIFQNTAQPCL